MSLENKFKLKLNTKEASNKIIPVVTANDTTVFEFEVHDGKTKLELLETYNFNFVTKPVGKGSVLYPAELNEDGNVVVELDFADVNHGHCDCALVMYEGEKRVSTMRMKVDVKGDLALQGDLPSESRRLIIADEALLNRAAEVANSVDGFNNLRTQLTYVDDVLTVIEELDGAVVKKRITLTYNGDGTLNTSTTEIEGKATVTTLNYVNGEFASVSNQLIEGGL